MKNPTVSEITARSAYDIERARTSYRLGIHFSDASSETLVLHSQHNKLDLIAGLRDWADRLEKAVQGAAPENSAPTCRFRY